MRKPKKELSEEELVSIGVMMIVLTIISYLRPVMNGISSPDDIVDRLVHKRVPIPTVGGKLSNKQHREKRKMIQVPVDTELLTALDRLSIKQRETMSEVIRQACRRFLLEVESERYKEGYEKLPEEPDEAIVQMTTTSEILSKDPW
jgi:hypothetical protein